ncbi:MAG: metabolite traffic protein EboE [Pseudomonadota bacterium]|nr:metabolite traffic protein EboE [Pseudomonadota bacterium]
MRLGHLPGGAELTYCTNIHAGETWEEIRRSLDEHVPRIKSQVSPQAPLGLGLRLSGIAAAELARPEALERFRDQLARLGCYVFTINAFPYGPFHGTRVKEQVYEPDWRTEERVSFTRNAARILAPLLPDGRIGSISTVPGAFKPASREPGAVDLMAERLLQAAADLVAIERATGRVLALALEPEPCCFLETVAETLAFFEDTLFAPGSIIRFGALTGLPPGPAAESLRRHLGVCYDVCHGAVEFEDPVAALRALKAAGISVPKIQLSAALRVPEMAPDVLPRLKRFDTGVYLHQVVARNGQLDRFIDLPQAFAAFEAGQARGEWRIHCHVPVFLPHLGDLGSTQDALVATLRALRTETFSSHLEVETYTWDVLPDHLKTASKADDIARELDFVLGELGHERHDDA